MTDKLDIGLSSDIQRRPDPSQTSSTVAALNTTGTEPVRRDLLYSSTRNGARTSAQSFNRLVGMGSLAQCLSGSNRMAAVTSLTVSG